MLRGSILTLGLVPLLFCLRMGQLDAADPSLLAHWTFDEPAGVACQSLVGPNAPVDASHQARRAGVHGGALRLQGAHALATPGGLTDRDLDAASVSVWVKPAEMGDYREILRQESDRRVLFSFQNVGQVLALGLNIDGYVECDAAIQRSEILDGQWHYCVGTFDGETMRIYLDGREVGSLARPGVISVDPSTPFYIGSSNGQSEHLQGGIDDLRVHARALAPEEIVAEHERGRAALAATNARLNEELARVYEPAESFADTMARTRARIASEGAAGDADLIEMLDGRIRADFPADAARFVEYTRTAPADYIADGDAEPRLAAADLLAELLLEYLPLTPEQWAQQSDAQRAGWDEAQRVADRLKELRARGAETLDRPEWYAALMDAGDRIDFRPYVREPVAPYITPSTPETRALTKDEARAALERDWLHQADGNPAPERVLREIGWARDLAKRIARDHPGKVAFDAELAELDELAARAEALTAPDADLYYRVREVKRRIAFANPVVDFRQVLFVDMPYPAGSESHHEMRHRLGYMAVPGARLLVLDGLSPDGAPRQLMPQAPLHGSFWRPDLSFDAKKVLFCFKPHNEKSFHLYEIDLDGTDLKQLTYGPYDDIDPIYLPGGEHIVFCTSRSNAYVRCMPPTHISTLARCDADGRNVYLTSLSNEPDYLPSVLNDGRLVYTRWEYTDKPLWRAQGLWSQNPDGTRVATLWGNQSVWPDVLKDARAIPGSRRILFTGTAHHAWFTGSIGIVDPDRGFNFPDGLTKVTADVEWPECGNGPSDPIESSTYHTSGRYWGYYSPYPLSERDFLVSASREGKFVLYLMDVDGNRELIYEGAHNILHALPIRPRPEPPVVPDAVAWPSREERHHPKDGIIYSQNVYSGAPEELQGRAKYLRILTIEPKTYTYWDHRPYLSTGPVVSMVQSDGVKRILGTVPIHEDGSVAFYVPAGKAVHLQLLDADYRALQTMRSFTGVMPGEYRGCLGCHEMHSTAPLHAPSPEAVALAPDPITPPPWGEDTVSYPRYVQPVLDQYCLKCHDGSAEAAEPNLTRRPGFLTFDEPYPTLVGYPSWGAPYNAPAEPPPGFGIAGTLLVEAFSTIDPAAYVTPEPMTRLSYRSRLIHLASSGEHYDVKVDDISLHRLIAWVDAMCPYNGEEEIRQIPDPDFQGIDWLPVRPRIATAPTVVRPGPVD